MTTARTTPQPSPANSAWYRPWSPLRNGWRSFDPSDFGCQHPATGRYLVGHYTDDRLRLLWLQLSNLAYPPTSPPVDWANHDGIMFGCDDCAYNYYRAVVDAGHSRYGGNFPPISSPR